MHAVAIHASFTQVCIRAGVTIATVLDVSQDKSHASSREGKPRHRRWTNRRYEPTGWLDGGCCHPHAVPLTWPRSARCDFAPDGQRRDSGNEGSSGSSAVIATNESTHCHGRARGVRGARIAPAPPHSTTVSKFALQQVRDCWYRNPEAGLGDMARVGSIEAPIANA